MANIKKRHILKKHNIPSKYREILEQTDLTNIHRKQYLYDEFGNKGYLSWYEDRTDGERPIWDIDIHFPGDKRVEELLREFLDTPRGIWLYLPQPEGSEGQVDMLDGSTIEEVAAKPKDNFFYMGLALMEFFGYCLDNLGIKVYLDNRLEGVDFAGAMEFAEDFLWDG